MLQSIDASRTRDYAIQQTRAAGQCSKYISNGKTFASVFPCRRPPAFGRKTIPCSCRCQRRIKLQRHVKQNVMQRQSFSRVRVCQGSVCGNRYSGLTPMLGLFGSLSTLGAAGRRPPGRPRLTPAMSNGNVASAVAVGHFHHQRACWGESIEDGVTEFVARISQRTAQQLLRQWRQAAWAAWIGLPAGFKRCQYPSL